MNRRSASTRAILWAAAFALVLQLGMPFLAVAAARLEGVSVGEVCEVYGVVLQTSSSQRMSGHAHHHTVEHAHHPSKKSDADQDCDHCALTALGALGAPNASLPPAATPPGPRVPIFRSRSTAHRTTSVRHGRQDSGTDHRSPAEFSTRHRRADPFEGCTVRGHGRERFRRASTYR